MDYRFEFKITKHGEDIYTGSTYISSQTSEFGENESVDMEVGKAMRWFNKNKDAQ